MVIVSGVVIILVECGIFEVYVKLKLKLKFVFVVVMFLIGIGGFFGGLFLFFYMGGGVFVEWMVVVGIV